MHQQNAILTGSNTTSIAVKVKMQNSYPQREQNLKGPRLYKIEQM